MSPTNQETIGSWLPNTNESEPSSDDYDVLEPLAIIGFSLEYPQDADTPEGFWSVLEEGRDVVTDWPKDRINLDAFFYRDENQEQKVCAFTYRLDLLPLLTCFDRNLCPELTLSRKILAPSMHHFLELVPQKQWLWIYSNESC
jgi:hypothetical protein